MGFLCHTKIEMTAHLHLLKLILIRVEKKYIYLAHPLTFKGKTFQSNKSPFSESTRERHQRVLNELKRF